MRSRFANLLCISLTAILVGGVALPAIGQTATQNETRPIDPLRYEEDIAAFEAEDAASRPPHSAIVITGSSSNDLLSYIDVATPFLDANCDAMTDIFVEDGLHLNGKGTRIWAGTIRDALMAGEAHHRKPFVTGSNR